MEHFEVVPQGAGGDHALDAGADGQAGATGGTGEGDGVVEDRRAGCQFQNRRGFIA